MPKDPGARPTAVGAGLELVVVFSDTVATHPLPLSGRVTIGRAEDNDVTIAHPSVSRRHAILHLDPPLSLQDLGGANGTFVRDLRERAGTGETQGRRRVAGESVPIALGDTINLGAVVGMLPVSGVPLPFLSVGGTSLVITMFGVGVVANIARQTAPTPTRAAKRAPKRPVRSRAS